ncbi:MAG: hypothetical protein LIO96_08810, partial [Lachnospiraceae bacterium]|nr:hypothetical protein [Lachnospiraceae bacterium]
EHTKDSQHFHPDLYKSNQDEFFSDRATFNQQGNLIPGLLICLICKSTNDIIAAGICPEILRHPAHF